MLGLKVASGTTEGEGMWVRGQGRGEAIGQGPFAGHAPGSYSQALSIKLSTHAQAHVLSPLPQPPLFPRSL